MGMEEGRLGSQTAGPDWWAQQDLNLRPLACKSWADRVEQCVLGVRPRRIFGGDLGPSAVVVGPLLHDCYMVVGRLITPM